MDDPREELERTRELLYVLMAERGEPEAFRWLVDRYEKRLLYFIRRSVDDTDRALDVLQEVWMTVFRRIAALRSARGLPRMALPHRPRSDDRSDARRPAPQTGGWRIDRRRERRHIRQFRRTRAIENAELIHRLLDRLTPAHREIVTLRFLEQMALDDIAAVVGCSLGTVKSRCITRFRGCRRELENGTMSEPTPKTFAEHLVAQDKPLSDTQYREHRMQLEKALTDASRRESRVRITVLFLSVLCLTIPFIVAAAATGRATGMQIS